MAAGIMVGAGAATATVKARALLSGAGYASGFSSPGSVREKHDGFVQQRRRAQNIGRSSHQTKLQCTESDGKKAGHIMFHRVSECA